MRTVQHAADYGVVVKGEISFDWAKVISRSRAVSEKLAGGVDSLFRKYGVTAVKGTASLTGRGKLDVKTATGVQKLEAPRIIIATGARAKFLPGIEADGDRVITYRDAMVLPEAPKSMVVIGAGAIGVEFADFWNAFGVEVTIIEFMPRLVPIEDEEISKALARSFQKKGIKVLTGTKTTGVKVSGKTVTTSYTTPDGKDGQITTDRVLLAVGVQANVEGIGLEGMGVKLDRGFIQVDDHYQTTSPGIWAVGIAPARRCWPTWRCRRAPAASNGWPASIPQLVNYDAIPAAPTAIPRSRRSARPKPRRARRAWTSASENSRSRSTARRLVPATPMGSSRSSRTRRGARSWACTRSATASRISSPRCRSP